MTQPVKTVKHAIGLAAANSKITTMILATGTYSVSSGETFPYTVPPNVTIVGPAGGGALLAGSKTEPGVTVNVGGLQDLDLKDFATAITATGTASLKNIRVLTSMIAVQAETSADLTVNNLDVTGPVGSCATGVVLNGAAKLMAATLATRNLGTTLDARDQSAVNIANAAIAGDRAGCSTSTRLMLIASTASFMLSDSVLDGGVNGISFAPKSTSFRAIISNTIIRNLSAAIDGSYSPTDPAASFQVTGGEISNNGAGVGMGSGAWTITNVTFRKNASQGIYTQGGALFMRGCTITGGSEGVILMDSVIADLGTVANPGNNVFQGNTSDGLVHSSVNFVNAAGNTWNANIQGADANGKYASSAIVTGPVASTNNGDNFTIVNSGVTLLR